MYKPPPTVTLDRMQQEKYLRPPKREKYQEMKCSKYVVD